MEWENLKERGPSHNKLPRVHQGQGRALFVFLFVFLGPFSENYDLRAD